MAINGNQWRAEKQVVEGAAPRVPLSEEGWQAEEVLGGRRDRREVVPTRAVDGGKVVARWRWRSGGGGRGGSMDMEVLGDRWRMAARRALARVRRASGVAEDLMRDAIALISGIEQRPRVLNG